jgi:hypothetical protein
VKIGAQWMGKIAKFSFGNYSITNSKAGWTTTTTKTNIWNTKTESKSSQKFSFDLSNGSGLSATCNALSKISGKEIRGFNLGALSGDFDWVLDAEQKTLLSAFITIGSDTGRTWILTLNTAEGAWASKQGDTVGILTDSITSLVIAATSSNKFGGDKRSLPALGYEFVKDNTGLGAVQYHSGGMGGELKMIVYLNTNMDADIKLLLAAASTAIMQIKYDAAIRN